MTKFEALHALADGKTVREENIGAPFRLHEHQGFQYWSGWEWRDFEVRFIGNRSVYVIVEEKLPL